MKVRVIAHAKAGHGRENELESAMRAMLAPTRAEDGCELYELNRSLGGDEFYFYEVWASEAALDAHNQTPHMAKLKETVAPLLSEPMRVTRLEADALPALRA